MTHHWGYVSAVASALLFGISSTLNKIALENVNWNYGLQGACQGGHKELVDYMISKDMILNSGYRYNDLDYSRGSGSDEFRIRLKAQGPVLGLTILF